MNPAITATFSILANRATGLLPAKIRKIIARYPDDDNCGVKRIQLALEQDGIIASRSTAWRTMKKGGLFKKSPRHSCSLTKTDADAQETEDLICRGFTAEEPNRKWLTDITQTPQDGKLYIASVLDCYNGEIVGPAMDGNMKKELRIR